MTDRSQETWLTHRILDFAEGGVRPIDQRAIAEAAILEGRRRSPWGRLSDALAGRPRGPRPSARPLVLRLVVLLLILAALVSAALAGGWIQKWLLPPRGPFPFVEHLGDIGAGQVSASGAALLGDGRVLFVGGIQTGVVNPPAVAHAWIFDPETNQLAATGDLAEPRVQPLVVTLHDGRALVVGGYIDDGNGSQPVSAPAEIYNPASGKFDAASGLPRPRLSCPCGALNTLPWAIPVANVLPDGRVFVAGGQAHPGFPEQLADLFDPASGTSSQLDVGCDASRGPQPLLQDGRVLVFCVTKPGGQRSDPVAVRARLFDPRTDTFSDAATPPAPARSAVVLADGDVLLTGFTPMLYHPARDVFEELQVALQPAGGPAFDIGDGRVLFLGEPDENSKSTSLLYEVGTRSFSAVVHPEFEWLDEIVRLRDGRILTIVYRPDTQHFDMLLIDLTQLP